MNMDFGVRCVMAALVVAGAAAASSLPAVSALEQSTVSNISSAVTATASPGAIRIAEVKKKAPPPKAAPKAPPPKKAVAPKVPPKKVVPKFVTPKAAPKKTAPIVKKTPTAPKKTAPIVKKTPPVKTTPIVKKPITKTPPGTKIAPKGPTKTPPGTKITPKGPTKTPPVTKITPKGPTKIQPVTKTPTPITPITKKAPTAPITKKPPVTTAKIKPGPKAPTNVTINNRNVTIINNNTVQVFRDRRTVFVGGFPRTLIAVGGLTAIAVAGISYYPESYVVLARPACFGVTEFGCALRWQAVATDDSFTVPQCVQFCRQGYVPPPPPPRVTVTALAAPQQIVAAGGCEIAIFSEANLSGEASETTEAQPSLPDVGWEDAIASVEVRRGIWDLFVEPGFGGEAIRLEPGSYRTLPPNFIRRINSFMCSEPT